MNKQLIIGIGAVATVGLVVGAVALSRQDDGSRRAMDEAVGEPVSAEDQAKIEDLRWEGWADAARYGFCLGTAVAETEYSDPVFNGHGGLKHRSQEVVILDKQEQRLRIVARSVEFSYRGSMNAGFGGLTTSVPVTEAGTISERYAANEMPVRLDFGNRVVDTSPDVKRTNWVASTVGDQTDMVASRTGCPGVFALDNSPGHDMLVGSEQIIIDRDCQMSDPVGTYVGEFSYRCQAMDVRDARALAETYAAEEKSQLTREEATAATETVESGHEGADQGAAGERVTPASEENPFKIEPQTYDEGDMKEMLEKLKSEGGGAAVPSFNRP